MERFYKRIWLLWWIKFEGEYLNGRRWEGKGYDNLKNIVYELKDGRGYLKGYYDNGKLMVLVKYKNIMIMVNYYLKENI